jgi:hypothetical protein
MSKNPFNDRKKAFEAMADVTADQINAQVRGLMADVGGPRRPGETMERWIERAGRSIGLPFPRAYSIWYGRVLRLAADEIDNIRRRAWASLVQAEARADAELAALRARRADLAKKIGEAA